MKEHLGNRFNYIVKELIIGFGFLNGLWYAIGTSPGTEILGFINRYLSLMPELLQKIILMIPFILMAGTIITIITVYRKGRILGIIAISLAFLSGAIILKNWKAALIVLLASIILGLISFKGRKK